MIRKLTASLKEIEQKEAIHFVLIKSRARHFCLGADLGWMSLAVNLSDEENLNECMELAELFEIIYASSKIYIAQVDGACYGGGIGLAAACDFVFATENAEFLFSEVILGLVPAIIIPYIIYRTGTQKAKNSILTGEKISSCMALEFGLIDFLTDQTNIDNQIEMLIKKLRRGGINAQQISKKLIRDLEMQYYTKELKQRTSDITARARISPEGSEGIRAFLERREPKWRR